MSSDRIRIGICVPTNRPGQAESFVDSWLPGWRKSQELSGRFLFTVFVHVDQPRRQFELRRFDPVEIVHTCHGDVSERLGSRSWIIPRGTGACRSFPILLAWEAGCDFILTLDDDCTPADDDPGGFIEQHLAAFEKDRWFQTIDGEQPRGMPYGPRGTLPVLLNHGLWTGAPDLDAATSLARRRRSGEIVLRQASEVIPPGMMCALSGMNIMYRQEAVPAAYNLLMGLEEYGLDRFDDVWSGLLLKRIADHLGLYLTTGTPFVQHERASNPFVNLRKESLGLHLHEGFWKHVADAPLDNESTISECYASLADWLSLFPDKYPELPCPDGYFRRLGEAMRIWLEVLVEGCRGPDQIRPSEGGGECTTPS